MHVGREHLSEKQKVEIQFTEQSKHMFLVIMLNTRQNKAYVYSGEQYVYT